MNSGALNMNNGLIVNLGPTGQIPLGHGKCFVVKNNEVAVFHLRNGEFSAINNKCPHKQGPLSDGIAGDGKVICPLHGHRFDLKTGKGSEEGECVNIFNTWVDQDNIMIEMLPSNN